MQDPAAQSVDANPLLRFYQSRVDLSTQQTEYSRKLYYPSLSLIGVVQTRGSGFKSNYAVDQTAFNHNYIDGITPGRTNYLFGVGLNWNLTSIVRNTQQVKSQQFIVAAMQNEYDLVDQQLTAQLKLADTKMQNALANYAEVPVQIAAASDAYRQKSALYQNGLTTIVEVTQTLYALNRAETNRDIIYTNVWQALLLKAAATGNIDLFINEF
jgi:outer membrane protein TolC